MKEILGTLTLLGLGLIVLAMAGMGLRDPFPAILLYMGAILFSGFGIWWGIRFHRRHGSNGTEKGAASDLRYMTKILGWLTFSGVVMSVLAVSWLESPESTYPHHLPSFLSFLGPICFLIGGIPWVHTRGNRGLKAALLGLVSFVVGGVAGGFLGHAVLPSHDMGAAFRNIYVGILSGAILGCGFGIWWVIWFHRRYGPGGTGKGSSSD